MPVSPDWFFSTLAQAAAASIGFILAFVTVIYSTRKNRVNDRTQRLVEHLSSVESEFDPLLEAMEQHLASTAGIPVAGGSISPMKEIELGQDELEEMAEGHSKPNTRILYANIVRTQKLLNLLVGPQPSDKKAEHLRSLNQTTSAMAETVGRTSNAIPLQQEITESEDSPDTAEREEVFPPIPPLQTWLESRYSSESGSTIVGWAEVLRGLKDETVRGGQFAQNTNLVVDFEEFDIVLGQVKRLFVIGVIVPMVFLLHDFPSWWISIHGLWLTTVEFLILLVICVLTWRLFGAISTLINLGSNLD